MTKRGPQPPLRVVLGQISGAECGQSSGQSRIERNDGCLEICRSCLLVGADLSQDRDEVGFDASDIGDALSLDSGDLGLDRTDVLAACLGELFLQVREILGCVVLHLRDPLGGIGLGIDSVCGQVGEPVGQVVSYGGYRGSMISA